MNKRFPLAHISRVTKNSLSFYVFAVLKKLTSAVGMLVIFTNLQYELYTSYSLSVNFAPKDIYIYIYLGGAVINILCY